MRDISELSDGSLIFWKSIDDLRISFRLCGKKRKSHTPIKGVSS